MAGHIFVNYSRADHAYVERLVEHLRSAGLSVWYDQELLTGSQWADVIEEQISSAAAMIVVMSPAAEESPWVAREINYAMDRGIVIVPLLLAGDPLFSLVSIQYADVRGGRLPDDSTLRVLRSSSERPPQQSADVRAPVDIREPGRLKVFVNYRRADSDFAAHWLVRYLTAEAEPAHRLDREEVFIDLDLNYVADWEVAVSGAIAECRVMLALIGPQWAGGGTVRRWMGSRRLDQRRDPVRRELELAVDHQVQIVPILLGTAEMPRPNHLPEKIQVITRPWPRPSLRATHFSEDAATLARIVNKLLVPNVLTPPSRR